MQVSGIFLLNGAFSLIILNIMLMYETDVIRNSKIEMPYKIQFKEIDKGVWRQRHIWYKPDMTINYIEKWIKSMGPSVNDLARYTRVECEE